VFDKDLSKRVESCFDDPRVELFFQDAQEWFTDRYEYVCDCNGTTKKLAERNYCKCPPEEQTETDSPNDKEDSETNEVEKRDPSRFDVIFMDTFDIKEGADLVEDMQFLESIYGALNPKGLLAMPLGPSPQSVDPSDRISSKRNRGQIITSLEKLGFQSIHVYEEVRTLFKKE
jgi:spermidine synthase